MTTGGTLLAGFQVAQLGDGKAAAVAGRMFLDAGADVTTLGASLDEPVLAYLNHGKTLADDIGAALKGARLIIAEGGPAALSARGHDLTSLRRITQDAAVVFISNFGQTGPKADDPATDLTLFSASGMARLLTGQVDDLTEPPVRAVGEQSAFIAGVAAACAGMGAALAPKPGAVADVSIQEALATLAITELTRGGLTGESWSRLRLKDSNGATVTILPAEDGYAAISPREERQWSAWLQVMGAPDWGDDPRFRTKADRVEHWDALYPLLAEWSSRHGKQEIADAAQAAHVPSFPLLGLADHLKSPQLIDRAFFRSMSLAGAAVQTPSAPYALRLTPKGDGATEPHGPLPLSGVRVLDFSWVIAGPTATRHMAALGAEVIKVEAPGRGDPGRASELHRVLGQAKQGIALDLKRPEALEIAKALAAKSDILIENFATGVMERLGLGAEELQAANPDLIYLSASGMGRTGPGRNAVAYGTLLQSYSGFAGLNRWPDRPPRVGFAWLDPMCGLMLPFLAGAAIWRRRVGGGGARVDFSMIEAMLWTLADPLLRLQTDGAVDPVGNQSDSHAPHGLYPADGDDAWLAVAVADDQTWERLVGVVSALAPFAGMTLAERRARTAEIDAVLSDWTQTRSAEAGAESLLGAGVPAAALATSTDLAEDAHLAARGFWDRDGDGVTPGLPWRADFGRKTGNAPALGADTEEVLRSALGLTPDEIDELRGAGVFGPDR